MDLRDTVQSIFMLLTLLSEYFVALDLGTFIASLSLDRNGLGQVVLLTLLYSFLEPTAYAFANSIAGIKVLPLLMSVFATLAVTSSLVGWASAPLPRQRQMRRAEQDETHREDGTPADMYSSAGRILPLTVLTTCAAFVNAGLRLCTRYLDTMHSQDWFDRFPFGWHLVGLLCIFAFFAAKICSLMPLWTVAPPSPQKVSSAWTLGAKTIAIILTLNLARAAVRFVFFAQQQPSISFVRCSHGAGFCIQPSSSSYDILDPAPAQVHRLDQVLYATPPWVSNVCSLLTIGLVVGHWWYNRRRFVQAAEGQQHDRGEQLDRCEKRSLEQLESWARDDISCLR